MEVGLRPPDGGVGIREALRRNPELQPQSDNEAIELALIERNSGTGERNRGLGFTWVRQHSPLLQCIPGTASL